MQTRGEKHRERERGAGRRGVPSLSLSLSPSLSLSMAAIDKAAPHVLVVPAAAQGHINPMMHLSKQLAACGVVVTFVNMQFNHERLLESQAAAGIPLPHEQPHSIGTNKLDIRLVGIPDGLGYEDYMVKYDIVKQCQALIDMEPLLVKLVEDQQNPPVTCIIADVFIICTPAVAKRFRIPHIAFWTQNAASYATHSFVTQNYAYLRGKLYPDEGEANEGNLITSVPGCPPLKLRDVPTFLQAMDPSDFVFNYLIRNFNDVLDSQYVLMNTFDELERESLASIAKPPKLVIGPMLPAHFVFSRDGDNKESNKNEVVGDKNPNVLKLGSSLWVEDEKGCIPWLDLQKPNSVLYVSFGSITTMSSLQIHEFAHGLEASGWPFLMVLRPELTIGRRATTFLTAFMDKMRSCGRATFVEWTPQLEVLAHPAIGGFLTHCGWNSTLESICMGVPMLCWPYFADQMINCKCIVDAWKVGLDFLMEEVEEENATIPCTSKGDDIDCTSKSKDKLTKFVVTRHEIECKVKKLMDPNLSTKIREQAKSFSLAAKEAYHSTYQCNLNLLLHFLYTKKVYEQ